MKQIVKYLVTIMLMLKPFTGYSQGTFQDLDFESASVASSPAGLYPPTFVPIASAMPGWAAYLGAEQQTQVLYNYPTLSTASVCLIGPTWNSSGGGVFLPIGIIDGNYSVVVQSGVNPNEVGYVPENASISQTGTVPATAQSLEFEATAVGPFSVSFAGNTLSPIALSSSVGEDGQPVTLYDANISAWAGDTGPLEFTADYTVNDPFIVLDDITFSPNPVTPEPAVLPLTALGGIVFAARKRLARH
jgi:hypothetical protein